MRVLVEKPLARSVAEADELLAAARARGRDRWRSATPSASIRRSRRRAPHLTRRGSSRCTGSGTFPDRSLDIDVVFDLMIHDLDVDAVDRRSRRSRRSTPSACRC